MKLKINKQKPTEARQESPFIKGAVARMSDWWFLNSKIQPLNSNAKGITLIGLIITIIVLLILTAITIDIAIDGQLFDKAEEAVEKTNAKVNEVQDGVNYWVGKLDEVELEENCTHTYGEWQITREATCIQTGERRKTCTLCGNVVTELIAKEEHTYTNGTCTKCSKECTHTFGEWETITQGTCTATGTKKRTCTKCGQGETDEISATGHSYGNWETTTEATCTEAGTQTKTCSVCNDKQTEAIVALGHNYVNGICSRCNDADLITFTLEGETCTCIRGWDWGTWLESTYNEGLWFSFSGPSRN